MKKILFSFLCVSLCVSFYVLLVVVIFPSITVWIARPFNNNYNYYNNDNQTKQPYEDYVTESKELNPQDSLESLDSLDDYIIGVVAAEMPALFHEEALKAQAVAARTYAIYHDYYNNEAENIGQAFLSMEERKERWGDKFDEYEAKIQKAVHDTKDEIIVYDGNVINAVFHSMSAGFTESGKNAWNTDVAYLQTVESSFEKSNSGFDSEKTITVSEFIKLCKNERKDFAFKPQNILITDRSEAGYVLKMQIGNQEFTGSEIRSLLNLKSSCFYILLEGNDILFSVKGYGHGAGMSQYGANEMAKNGYGYKDILMHYYTDVSLSYAND